MPASDDRLIVALDVPDALSGLSLLRERAVGERMAPLVYPLMVRLDDTPDRADALMEALGLMSQERIAPNPNLWKEWWRRAAGERTLIEAPVDAEAG